MPTYALAFKANHQSAFEEISQYLDDLVEEKQKACERPETMPDAAKLLKSHSVTEKDHGRTTTRALALNLTRLETTNKRGIKDWVKRAGWDNAYLEKILRI